MNETKNVSKRTRNPIFFRMGGGWKSVSTDSIMYMEASACKCRFFMDDGTVKEVEMPLCTALAKTQEQATTLLRVHRSYAVNIEHNDMVYNDSIIMQNKKRIPIGRDYHDSVPRNLVLIDKRDRSVSGDIDDSDKLKRTTTKKKRKYITPSISIIHEGCERHIQIMKEIEKQRKIEASETSRLNSHKE